MLDSIESMYETVPKNQSYKSFTDLNLKPEDRMIEMIAGALVTPDDLVSKVDPGLVEKLDNCNGWNTPEQDVAMQAHGANALKELRNQVGTDAWYAD